MPIARVNGREVEFTPGMTVLQVAELAGEEIPRFCYHDRLSIAGNCRMCLVEVKPGPPKPQASCALPASDNQEIFTNTPMVKKAREGVMEFLLINHPLDCPICDQGGECDLQDQAMAYGRGGSRYYENQRAVDEKPFGPTIKTFMTRCIQCTRCVRFSTEIAGVTEMGLVNRGENAEITSYLEAAVTSELSGNLNDICPVGALTHRPWSFNYRPWELTKTETIDVFDALGANIRIDNRGAAVLRALPRTREDINEEWLSDKSRYAVDGLSRQRLDRPYHRVKGKLDPVSWEEALKILSHRLTSTAPEKIGALAGDLCDVEGLKAAKDVLSKLGVVNLDCRVDGAMIGGAGAPRESYLFNSGIAGIEDADAVLMIGCDLRHEAPLINTRIRKSWMRRAVEVAVIGEAYDLTYDYAHLGNDANALKGFKKSPFASIFAAAKKPAVLIGAGALARSDGAAILNLIASEILATYPIIRSDWNGFNIVHHAAGRVGALDLGFVPGKNGIDANQILAGACDVTVLLGVDEADLSTLKSSFVVYIGSHGDRGAQAADLILPAAAYTEKSGLYVNMEGRVQLAEQCVFPKGEAKVDWTIWRALADHLNLKLGYDDLKALRRQLADENPIFGALDMKPAVNSFDINSLGQKGSVSSQPLATPLGDFYLTNPIARASLSMAEISRVRTPNISQAAE